MATLSVTYTDKGNTCVSSSGTTTVWQTGDTSDKTIRVRGGVVTIGGKVVSK